MEQVEVLAKWLNMAHGAKKEIRAGNVDAAYRAIDQLAVQILLGKIFGIPADDVGVVTREEMHAALSAYTESVVERVEAVCTKGTYDEAKHARNAAALDEIINVLPSRVCRDLSKEEVALVERVRLLTTSGVFSMRVRDGAGLLAIVDRLAPRGADEGSGTPTTCTTQNVSIGMSVPIEHALGDLPDVDIETLGKALDLMTHLKRATRSRLASPETKE